MILISKEEATLVREKYKDVHIRRTMKQKSGRHRYYLEESPRAMTIIRRLRRGNRGN